MEDLKRYIREVPDWPKPGILFYDITTLLKDPLALRMTVDRFVWMFAQQKVDKVVGMESRGFMFGPIVAYDLNAGFVPVRKPGKLPAEIVEQSYELEYGTDRLQVHRDAIVPGERVLIVDDLVATGGTARATAQLIEGLGVATGGTARATAQLIEGLGGEVVGMGFIIELTFLAPRQRLSTYRLESLIQY